MLPKAPPMLGVRILTEVSGMPRAAASSVRSRLATWLSEWRVRVWRRSSHSATNPLVSSGTPE